VYKRQGIFFLFVISYAMKDSKTADKPIAEPAFSPIQQQEEKKRKEAEQAKNISIVLRLSALREDTKNPPSFELVEAIVLDNGMLCVTYRGTNGFGGVVTESRAITNGAKIVNYAANCNGKSGDDVTHLKQFLKKL
jgi:hypothetical protein